MMQRLCQSLEFVPDMEYNKTLEVFIFMEYLTAVEIAEIWGISSRRVRVLCNEGRVEGAITKGNLWLIPYNASKPKEQRRGRKSDISSCR